MTPPPPSGWYPDPQDPSRERWFDSASSTWLEHTRAREQPAGPPPAGPTPPERRSRLPLYIVAGLVAVLLIIGIASAVNSGGGDDSPKQAEVTTPSVETPTNALPPVATTTTTTVVPTTTAPAANCTAAPSQLVAIIGASFNDDAYSLGTPAFSVTAPGDLIYISADILKDGQRGLSEAVWVAKGAAVFSLSGSARRTSLLPDGRDILNVSAGDEYGVRAQECVGAAR